MKLGNTQKNKAFTISELMVVIVVLGTLAAIATPKYTRVLEKGRSAEAEQILGALYSAQKMLFFESGSYTADENDLELDFPAPKYFDIDVYTDISQLAVLTRKSGPAYSFLIDENAIISCTGDAEYCLEFGY